MSGLYNQAYQESHKMPLLDIIHDKLQPLGLARTESIISFKEAFRQPLPIDDLS